MQVLLTGGTGFLGRHIASALVEAGHDVRALCRSSSDDLEAMGASVVRGDVTDRQSLVEAMAGISHVIHAAGLVSRDRADTRSMMQVHVLGMRQLMEAAIAADVKRVVHLSTSGTTAVGDDENVVFHEDDPVPLGRISAWPYYLSKHLAERAAQDAIRLAGGGPEVVTLCPTLTLGPGDRRGSSTGDVRRFLDRRVPFVPAGGLSFVDVRDVASAAVAALTAGRDGERYLLGALNMTFADFFARLSEVSGVSGPALGLKVPKPFLRLGASLLERAFSSVGASSPVTEIEAEMSSCFWYVDARKAEAELAFRPRDPMRTLLDTVRDLQ